MSFKGLTGGTLPLGLTVASEKIYNAFLSDDKKKALLHGHSFTGNASSLRCCCASLDLFEESKHGTTKNIVIKHQLFKEEVKKMKWYLKVRQTGTF